MVRSLPSMSRVRSRTAGDETMTLAIRLEEHTVTTYAHCCRSDEPDRLRYADRSSEIERRAEEVIDVLPRWGRAVQGLSTGRSESVEEEAEVSAGIVDS